jgi:FAD/FMN-containing dehydrogenase
MSRSGLDPAQIIWRLKLQKHKWRAVLQEAIGRMRLHIAQAGVTRHYANYPDLAFKDWPTAYYGAENYARLQQLKRRYDPENRIRYPQSVQLPD